jgi:hypothetical protein
MTKELLFDHYSFRARLQPALLTVLPLAIAVFAWTGPGDKMVSALWTLAGTAGVTYFLAIIARKPGKQLEPQLWASWGGAPTTQLLRHSGPANPELRERWHRSLSKLVGKPFPTAETEKANPVAADDLYAAGVKLAIGKTGDRNAYPLVYKELVYYGFCRNLYGLRPVAILVALLGLFLSGAAGWWFLHIGKSEFRPWLCAGLCAAFVAAWYWFLTSELVKVPAFAYAERLLESTERISKPQKATPAIKK